MHSFLSYFEKQWINSKFNNWQLFNTPAGYAGTNNPIESYNKTIKAQFTNYLKYNICPVLEIFRDAIEYESKQDFDYKTEKVVTRSLKSISNELSISQFNKLNVIEYEYKHSNNTSSFINLKLLNCSCFGFLDKGICKHLVRTCIIDKIALPGLEFKKKFSIRRKKRNENVESTENTESVAQFNDTLADATNLSNFIEPLPVVESLPIVEDSSADIPEKKPSWSS